MAVQIKGIGILIGANTTIKSPNIAILEGVKFTPRYAGPLVEVEDDQGVVKAFALQSDGGDFAIDSVYESNSTTSNFTAMGVGNTVVVATPVVNGGNNCNCTITALPEVTQPRKGETKVSFKAIWRPGAVA